MLQFRPKYFLNCKTCRKKLGKNFLFFPLHSLFPINNNNKNCLLGSILLMWCQCSLHAVYSLWRKLTVSTRISRQNLNVEFLRPACKHASPLQHKLYIPTHSLQAWSIQLSNAAIVSGKCDVSRAWHLRTGGYFDSVNPSEDTWSLL